MARLRPCTACHRHVRRNETNCPFCDADLATAADGSLKVPGTPLTRAAIIFGAATVVAACTSGGPDTPGPSSSSGGSSSGNTSSSSGAAPAYGVPEIDSGDPDTKDSGGPVALYGPAPIPDGG
jgi:hypothetical protein